MTAWRCCIPSAARERPGARPVPWMQKYIFPGGYSPALSETMAAIEGTRLVGNRRRNLAAALRHDAGRMGAPLPGQPPAHRRTSRRALLPHVGILPGHQRIQLPPPASTWMFQIQLTKSLETLPIDRDYMGKGRSGPAAPLPPSPACGRRRRGTRQMRGEAPKQDGNRDSWPGPSSGPPLTRRTFFSRKREKLDYVTECWLSP